MFAQLLQATYALETDVSVATYRSTETQTVHNLRFGTGNLISTKTEENCLSKVKLYSMRLKVEESVLKRKPVS